jgi:arthrofactin-type cyclic lipopeptide synthetase C
MRSCGSFPFSVQVCRLMDQVAAPPADLPADAWNRTEAAYPAECCVHELFEARVARTPDAVAVTFEGGGLTYAQLNARANRLAHHLIARGVAPDVCVGLCLERGPEMIVALLAVLKAGGAYLPLDPEYPEDRLRYMLADGAPAVLLTQASLAERFAGAPCIRMDADAAEWADEAETNPARGALAPDHLVYVIYTSGSTGQPKGVMNQHRALVNRVTWGRRSWGIGAADVVLCKTSLNFDGSVRETFLPLIAGARVVLARPGGQRDPLYLLEVIGREGITTVNLVPSQLQVLLEAPQVDNLRALKRILCGGEALPGALLERFRARLPEVELYNLYGPSEAATAVTAPRVQAEPGRAIVPIGGPSANARVYVLDGAGERVPVGVAGELYIGGVPVARGYLGRAALTAERFVPDPFGAVPGSRLYRTGDVVRWLTDGRLDFVGRDDAQIKVRGFRVEPGEIEARLREHPGVREAVVIVREDVPGDPRLVAYCAADAVVEVDSLRAHLAERLPEHMVPAAYVRLETLPLSPNGKLDRQALPAPRDDAYARDGYEAPVGETEQALAEIWAEVLGVERVGRRDNFFALGGHSLLAARVIARMRQALGMEIPVSHVFSYPTVESLAAHLSAPDAADLADRAIAVRATGSQPPLFLAYTGAGSVAYAQKLHPHLGEDVPVYALPAPPLSDASPRTVEGMATRLRRMIREVQPAGPYRVGGWSFGGVLAYEIASQLIGENETVEFVGMIDSYAPALSMDAATADGGGETSPATADYEDADVEAHVARQRAEGELPDHVTVPRFLEMRDRRRVHQQALRGYDPQPLPVVVHLFAAREESPTEDPSHGWRDLLPERWLRVTPVPGTHQSMMDPPNVAVLGEALSRRLESAGGDGTARPGEDHSPILNLRGGKPGAAPTFCVPGAGTSVTSFMDLSWCLEPSWPVYGLQPRGMDAVTVPHTTVQAAAEHYLRAVHQACPQGPLHLLGHSFGGWVAFEMALRLRQAGRPVASLTLLDTDVPDDSEALIREYDGVEAFLKLIEVLELTAERSLGITSADARARDEAGRLKLLHGKMLQHGLITARSTHEALHGPLRTFARCLRTTYRPSGEYPDRLRLVLVADPGKDGDANRRRFEQAVRGWKQWAPGLVFSAGAGNHVTALKLPHVATLAAFLAEDRG